MIVKQFGANIHGIMNEKIPENPPINKVKASISRFWSVFLQKTKHLLQELSDDPTGGFFWWLKTHKQKLALDEALEKLKQDARKPGFQLDRVTEVMLKFKLKKDDAGQAQWYQDAHNQLIKCQLRLAETTILTTEIIKPALTELRFISEADQFHQQFQLQPLQRSVREMYEAIIERIDTLIKDNKNKKLEHKTELDVREQEAKAQQAAELTRQHEVLMQKEAAELKKVEAERALLDQQRDAEEESFKRDVAERQLRLQETQQKHQMELQNSFSNLQLEDHDQTNNLSERYLDALLKQIKDGQLDRSDPKIKEQLQALLQAIAGL